MRRQPSAPRASSRTALAVALTVVGMLAAVAVLGLLTGCAAQTVGTATVAPPAEVSTVVSSSTATTTTVATSVVTVTAGPGPTVTAPAPATVTATATTVIAVPVLGERLPGDLGLAQPITEPSCDGLGIVITKSAVTPGAYAAEVAAALAATPGSSYLRTDLTCPSLTPSTPSGDPIYAAYVPAGYGRADVCRVLRDSPSGSYGRWLSRSESPDHTVDC